MWINHIFLAFVGLASGLAVAGGTFALIVSLKIIPRIVGKGHLASRTVWFENMIVLGGIWGTIFAVFPMIRFPVDIGLLPFTGYAAVSRWAVF